MAKLTKKSVDVLKADTKKRPNYGRGRGGKMGRKGGFLTKHHPESKEKSISGAEERRTILKWRAMELKTWGYALRAIAQKIAEEFELVKVPQHSTIDLWLDEAFAEAVTAKQKDADRHCELILLRTEDLIRQLLPLAHGKVAVSRKRVVEGEEIEVIDERAIEERLKAMAETRKLMETQAKLLKIGRVGIAAENEDKQLTGANLTVLIESTVNQIIFPGDKPKGDGGALLLASGDADIDMMDGEALAK